MKENEDQLKSLYIFKLLSKIILQIAIMEMVMEMWSI